MSKRRRVAGAAAAAAVILLAAGVTVIVAGSGSDDPSPRPSAKPAQLELTQLASFKNTLTGLVASADGSEMLVSDRIGGIWRLDGRSGASQPAPKLDAAPILDLTEQVSSSPGERGLFSLILSPDGGSLLVDYTSNDGTITVAQYPYEPGKPIDPGAARTVFSIPDPYGWHHGGGTAFDREGNLLVGIGDFEFRQLDPPGAQDPDLTIGGILRIPARYITDPTSEFVAKPSDMIARGLRNPWRLSVDPKTGDLWIGEVGQDTYEEVNRIPASDLDGDVVTNFGWPYLEGTHPQQAGAPADLDAVAPLLSRKHGPGVCGMVGGYQYRGAAIPSLQGSFVYGDLCGTSVRALTTNPEGRITADRTVADGSEPFVSFGQDTAGELYGLGAAGGLYRLDPAGTGSTDSTQAPPVQKTTTTILSTGTDCRGVVEVMMPLSDMASMDGPELQKALDTATEKLAKVVPTLPDATREDGIVVQHAIGALAKDIEAAGGDPSALGPVRADLLAGRGEFRGFPDAMARIVDSECG